MVYNATVPASKEVAEYYAQKRHIPPANLVGVKVPDWEDLTRQEYDQQLVPPVRQKVVELRRSFRNPAIVLVYGIPLRVGEAGLDAQETGGPGPGQTQVQPAAVRTWGKLQELQGLLTKIPDQNQAPGRGPGRQGGPQAGGGASAPGRPPAEMAPGSANSGGDPQPGGGPDDRAQRSRP